MGRLAIDGCLRRAGRAPVLVNRTRCAAENASRTANTSPGDSNRKASAAAEVIRSSRASSTGGLLFDASFLPVHVP
jgi:hypothetical protein